MVFSEHKFKKAVHKSKYKRKKVNISVFLLLFFFIFLIISFTNIYNKSFKPIIRKISEYKASDLSTRAISKGVSEVMSENQITYSELVSVHRTPEGKVTSLSVNFIEANRLQSDITTRINELINSEDRIRIYIPFGNLTGIELFSGLGPMIGVNLVPSGNTVVDFENTFTSAGINQTRHTVSLKITSKVSMLMPNNLSSTSETVSYVPIAESIITGEVPDTYTELDTSIDELRDDIMNLQ